MLSSTSRSSEAVRAIVVATALVALVSLWAPFSGTAVEARGDGASAGITVHGDWTIDVLEGDGTLVASHEFENALQREGGLFLIGLMSGEIRPRAWAIGLDCGFECYLGITGDPTLVDFSGGDQPGGFHVAETLETSYDDEAFILQGTAIAHQDFRVGTVETFTDVPVAWLAQSESFDFEEATSFWTVEFTRKSMASDQIDVMEGQQVVVRVEVSFS